MLATRIKLGLIGLAALGATATTAQAAVDFPTPPDGWDEICYSAQGDDRVLSASDDVVLTFEGDGNLAMFATNSAGAAIWETGTAGSNREICFSDDGDLKINNYETGATLWSRTASGSTISIDSDCDLIATNSSGAVQWAVSATCPGDTDAASFNGWCADASEEAVLAESDWAQLKWLTTGKLAVVGTGDHDGETVWTTSTAGAKLCFEDGGRLAIYASETATSPFWTAGSVGSTDNQYLLGLEDCAIQIDNFNTGAGVYDSGTACGFSSASRGASFTAVSGEDVVVLQNDYVELSINTGTMRFELKNGAVLWKTTTTSIARLDFQSSDGNLVLYNSAGVAQWSTGANSSASKLQLDGCRLQVVNSSGTELWGRGPQNCSETALALDGSTLKTNQIRDYLLRVGDSYLRWSDGNLCLYNTSGVKIWCALSSNISSSNYLVRNSGSIVIKNSAGTSLWTKSASGATSIDLADGCLLTLKSSTGSTLSTINAACTVNFSYESTSGNKTVGLTMSASATETNGSATAVDDVSEVSNSLDIILGGITLNVFEANGKQIAYDNGVVYTEGGAEVTGDTFSASFSVSMVFYTQSWPIYVGAPLTLTVSATGTVGLSYSYDQEDAEMTFKPYEGLYASVSVALGATSSGKVVGASLGIKGTLSLIDYSLPFKLTRANGRNTTTWTATLQTLSGTIAAYAEFYVKVLGVKVSVSASKKLYSWTGLKWTKTLLSWSN